MLKILLEEKGERTLLIKRGDNGSVLEYSKNPVNPDYDTKIFVTAEEIYRQLKLLEADNYAQEVVVGEYKKYLQVTPEGKVLKGSYGERPKEVGKLDGLTCPLCRSNTFTGYMDTGQAEFNFRECTHCDWTARVAEGEY